MSVAQPLRVLNLYDVLTDFVPGVIVVGSLFIYLTVSFTIELGVLVVLLGYIVGHVLQFFRSYLPGGDTFQVTVKTIRSEVSEGDEIDDKGLPLGQITEIQRRFVDMCWQKFELSDDYDSYGELFKLLLSYLETRPAKRGLRFQALYSFHRSMVLAMFFVVLLASVSLYLDSEGYISITSKYLAYGTIGTAAVFGGVFYVRKQYFEKEFVRYVILDFYQDQKSE